MSKPSNTSKPARRRRTGPRARTPHEIVIATALETIGQIQPETPRAASVIALLQSWLEDDSGYDEKAWPKLQKALDEQRAQVGTRRLFNE